VRAAQLRAAGLLAAVLSGCQPSTQGPASAERAPAGLGPLSACEWCGAAEAPAELSWDLRIAGEDEPGEALVLEGRIFLADGRTPAAGVLMYAYHTNSAGVYPKRGDETGNGRRHGYLRGWLRTSAEGRYRIRSIRPGAYPDSEQPQHIHVTLRPPGGEEFWIDDFGFDDDPLLTDAVRAELDNIGGFGIMVLEGNAGVGWRGRRDIVLPD